MTENAVQLIAEAYFKLVKNCFVCANEWFRPSRPKAQWKDIDILALNKDGKEVYLVACQTYPESSDAWKRAKTSILDAESWVKQFPLVKGRDLIKWFVVDVERPKRKRQFRNRKSFEDYDNDMKSHGIVVKTLKEIVSELLQKLQEKYPKKTRRVGKEKTGARLLLHLLHNEFIKFQLQEK